MYEQHFFYLQLAIFCALLIFAIDYGLGKPGDDQYNPQALLFNWCFFLAKKRLIKTGEWWHMNNQLQGQLQAALSKKERLDIFRQFKMIVFQNAKDYFKYEKILGMCPICTHWWISFIIFLIVNFCYFQVNIFTFMLYKLFSHLLIRLFKRI